MKNDQIILQYEPIVKKQLVLLNNRSYWDDLYQIGLIALWEAAERYDKSSGKFSTFAIKTVRGKMLAFLKKQKSQQLITAKLQHFTTPDCFAASSDDWLIHTLPHINWAIFSKNEKLWIEYGILQDYHIREIAEELNVSRNAVNGWRREAIKKLRLQAYVT